MKPITEKCGIVCEYNPFHNGHAYHIKKTRELTGAEIVCVMSGDFVQRAEPAVFDKRIRAQAAIDAGADTVIELPVVYSTAGAEQFAYGAISVMASIKGLKYISFGVETDNIELLKVAVEIQLDESQSFKTVLKNNLEKGINYPAAISLATTDEYEKFDNHQSLNANEFSKLLRCPNNILAIEYLKAIKRANLNITPIFVTRTDGGYNSTALTPPFAAAGAIRGLIAKGKPYTDFTPADYGQSPVDYRVFEALMRQTVLRLTCASECAYAIDAGFLQKIKKGAQAYSSLDEIVKYCKSKNNTYSSIKRAIFHIMSDITCDILDYKGIFYAKLLAIKKSFKASLKDLNDNILISAADEKRAFCNRNSDMDADKTAGKCALNPYPLHIYNIDKCTSDLYALITNQDSRRYFKAIYTPLF